MPFASSCQRRRTPLASMSADGFARIVPRLQTLPELPVLTSRERILLAVTAVAVALSRLLAISATLWDWDEALFYASIRDFDVTQHHPHPPGFPLYVGAAKLLALALPNFRAFQALNVLAACALFPIVFLLAREMRFPKPAAYLGALLFVFLPNVWFYGGTAFSDVSGTALVLAAAFLLLRGRTDGRAYVAGAIVLGLAAGIRSQALLIGCAPALMATWSQWRLSIRRVFGAVACGALVVAACYASAALASDSVQGFFATSKGLQEYIRRVDSYQSPTRPSLRELAPEYFVWPMRGGRAAIVLSFLAGLSLVLGLVRRDRAVVTAAVTFLPFAVFTWLMLDHNSISRYSVSYLALHAMLVAGLVSVTPVLRQWRFAALLAALLVVPFVVKFSLWTFPALQVSRSTVSPTEESLRWIDANLGGRALLVHGSMSPFVTARLPHVRAVHLGATPTLDTAVVQPSSLYLVEGVTLSLHATRFVRERRRLWELVRKRYFEVAVLPATEAVKFGEGWYDLEGEGGSAWRWMGERSTTTLPAIAVPAELTLRLTAVEYAGRKTSQVTVTIDGEAVGRFSCSGSCEQRWTIAPRGSAARQMVITADWSVNPAKLGIGGDGRDLALQLDGIGWIAAAKE
jgi:hypothetical protein